MLQLYVALAVLAICLYFKWTCSYWRRQGKVDGPQPLPIFGNLLDQITGKKHFGEIFEEIYRSFPKAAFVGYYKVFNRPGIVVRDLDLVKDVLSSQFTSFDDNDFTVDEQIDPLLMYNPFTVAGETWKQRRAEMVSTFALPRIRATFPIVHDIAKGFLQYIERTKVTDPNFEAKDICSKYTTNTVASVAFGIDAESFTNPDAEFCRMGTAVFAPTYMTALRSWLGMFAPSLGSLLRVPFIPSDVDQWFRKMVGETIKKRKNLKVKHQDFFQVMYDNLSHNGTVDVDLKQITGHSLTFLTEGFETSSTLMCYFFYEMAANPAIQERVVEELRTVLAQGNGQLTEADLHKLTYMESTMLETLRLHSPVFTLPRICTQDFELPPQYPGDTQQHTISKGTPVVIPVYAIHHDPDIYPNPFTFDPERFTEGARKTRHRFAFLAFGEGPRLCLGMKFAIHQIKIGLATVLEKYRVRLSAKQELPLEFARNSFLLAPKSGIWLNFEERQ